MHPAAGTRQRHAQRARRGVVGDRVEVTVDRHRVRPRQHVRPIRAQRAAPDRLLSAVLAYRVLDIAGVDPKDKRAFLEDLTLRDADFLVDEFDRVDCGVDTTIEIECPECFQTQEVELPFDKGFFLPGKDRTARRKARSSSSPT